jgi:hypothetical protein
LELFRGDVSFAEEREHEALAGVVEEAVEDVADFGAAGIVFGYAGAVEEGAAFQAVLHVALLLKDTDGGEDRGVGEGRMGGKGRDEVADERLAALPEDTHDA